MLETTKVHKSLSASLQPQFCKREGSSAIIPTAYMTGFAPIGLLPEPQKIYANNSKSKS